MSKLFRMKGLGPTGCQEAGWEVGQVEEDSQPDRCRWHVQHLPHYCEHNQYFQYFKDAGLDLANLTHRRKIEIISVYLTWIRVVMNTWQLSSYCLDEITYTLQVIQF
ncbi:uncharacterized protein LOC26526038 [Drosophila erecta]|uniref:Uncharacterized protein n=1 Tax=Drosophila erecta TaxID=7220 RepID=A0A0Q5WMV3_DROER|nr:uncharacterized protein LOC26526038 [Drosophila erecta]KQS70232.1 uncharacterized protein Dere_GG26214 [Drosophila erecta]